LRISWWSRIGLLLAVGFFIAAGYFYRESAGFRYSHVWMPLSIPLALAPGEIESPEFAADKGIYYVVEIAPHGGVIDEKNARVSWIISENGQAVTHGAAAEDFGGDSDERFIGSFRPEHDGHYKLNLVIHKLTATVGTEPPELRVILDPGQRSDIVDGAGILEFMAGICGFLGLLALAFAVAGIITRRKVVRPDASSVKSV
jgi:hypothetical protein